jgi:predicted acyltransferase (DUF342 family)
MLVLLLCKFPNPNQEWLWDSSDMCRIQNGVRVEEKVDASGSLSIDGGEQGVSIAGKVAASGNIEITGWVEIGGDVKSNGQVKIRSFKGKMVKVGGKIDCSGGCLIEGDMTVE